MAAPPPPSYDDVVGTVPSAGTGEPSAPPLGVVRPSSPGAITPLMAHHTQAGYDAGESLRRQGEEEGGSTSTPPQKKKRAWDKGLEGYVRFSLAHTLRMNLEPDPNMQDPELDVEAQFSRHVVRRQKRVIANKMRLQCVSGWLWCLGVIVVLAFIGVPIGMFITGIAGMNECPFRGRVIPIYLISGGIVLGLTVILRAIPSAATIGKNHNWCHTRNSSSCSGGICAIELFFYVILIVNFILLALGSYWVFSEKPRFECEDNNDDCDDYCEEGVYVGGVIFLILQYALYVVAPVYMCITISCNHCLRRQELE